MRTLADAGYAPSQLKIWHNAARAGQGLIIIAGVTGSGKSTSLKVFIETLPGLLAKAIYTVEDPIKYEIVGAHQIEVLRGGDDEESRRRYAAAMKALMRADLDGCMVGEIRDKLTAGFALQLAETGHLAMGTLRAHLISNIVPRLTSDQVGLSRQALTGPNIVNLLVYQALVPLVCLHCAQTPQAAATADDAIAELLELLQTKFHIPLDAMRFKHVGGCAHCQWRGTKGTTVVAELWQPDRQWLQWVRENEDYRALLHYRSYSDGDFCSENMNGKTVFEHALFKAINGLVDPRDCEEFDTFERFEVLGSHRWRCEGVS